MTRLLTMTDGAETGDRAYWDAYDDGLLAAQDFVRSGDYSYKFGANVWASKSLPAALQEAYIRFGLRIDAGETGAFPILRFRWSGYILAVVKYHPSIGRLELCIPTDTVVAYAYVPMQQETWYLAEIHLKIDNLNGYFEARVDSVPAGGFNGDTQYYDGSGGGPNIGVFDNLQFLAGSSNLVMWIDDLAVNDTSGSVDNTWCGDGHIQLLRPNANGDLSQWTGSDGNSVDNYLLVDEVIPDGDGTYIEDDVTGHRDMFHVEDYNGAGRVVRRCWAEARAKSTEPTGESIKLGVKVSGSVYLGNAVQLINQYQRVVGADLTENPATSSAWQDSEIDATQVVVEAQ